MGSFSYDGFSRHPYNVIFIDDHSRCTWVYLLKKKFDVLPLFTQFFQMIKTQYNIVVRAIRSDNGGEYIYDDFRSQFNQKGILQQLTCPHTPEQNGVVERKKRHIMSIIHCPFVVCMYLSLIGIWLFLLWFTS
jgi:transposase InsO family protein